MKAKELKEILNKIPDNLNVFLSTYDNHQRVLKLGSVTQELNYGFNDVFDVKEIRQKEIVILRQTPYHIVEDDNL